MQYPFPGMNPYLEDPTLWPDVHNSLISAIRDQLQPLLVPHYRAAITSFVGNEDLVLGTTRAVIPDVGLLKATAASYTTEPPILVEAAPLTSPMVLHALTEYARIEIRRVRDQRLVTVIEVLSPTNKRPGFDHAETYERKRQDLMQASVHLLEIDLLRAGQHPYVACELPRQPYFIFLNRVRALRYYEIWPIALADRIPGVPVPLLPPDADVPLDLRRALREIYQKARYDLVVEYQAEPPLPELSQDERNWLVTQLATVK